MKKTMSRREMLKAMTMGAAGVILAACAPAATQAPTSTTAPQAATQTPAPKAVTITWLQAPIWRFATDNTTVLGAGSDAKGKDWVSRFQKLYPNITVDLQLVPWDQWGTKLTTMFASGNYANVIYSQVNIARVQAGVFAPLDQYLTSTITDNWLTGAKDQLTYLGHVYGVPIFYNPSFMVLNQSSLEANGAGGIIQDVGADRSGLTFDMMTKYAQMYDDNKTRYFFGVPMDHGSILYWMFGAWMEGWGVKTWNDDQSKWIQADDPNAVKAMQWLLDGANSGILPPAKSLPKWSDIDNFQWSGNLGMRYQWAGDNAELATAQAAGQAAADFKLFFVGPPHTADSKSFAFGNAASSYNVGSNSDQDILDASFKFANWMSTDDACQVSFFVEGTFPGTKTGIAAIQGNPLMSDPNVQWVANTYIPNYPLDYPGDNWDPNKNAKSEDAMSKLQPDEFTFFIQELQSMMLGQKSPSDMLNEIQTTINTALGVS
jgi:ABC-type glycerol-3-phosphate transport system substrate-binding protein